MYKKIKDFLSRDNNPLVSLFRSNGQYVPYVQWTTTAITIWALFTFSASWLWLFLAMNFLVTCYGIICTHHKLLTHNSYIARWKWIEYLGAWFAACAGTGSGMAWAGVHRYHHLTADKATDPHPPTLKWKLFRSAYDGSQVNKWNLRDLIKDKFHLFIHNYYWGLLALYGIILWTVSIWAIGGPQLVLFGFVMPMAAHIWISNLAIWRTHRSGNRTNGYRNFETHDKSVNDPFMALIAWGEGWHNNHHAHPGKWDQGVKWWEIDISSYWIRLIKSKKEPKFTT